MKKFLLPLLALAAFNFGTAQEESIRFGAKAGLNIANLAGDEVKNNEIKIGFNVGVLVEIPITEKFAIQPEFLFSTQGSKSDEGFPNFSETLIENLNQEFESNINYINIPIMTKYYLAKGLSIQAGPQVGILISAKDRDDNDIKDNISSIDLGLNFGAGYQLASGIFFDARYSLGLTNILDFEFRASPTSTPVILEAKNSVISISLGYKF